MLTHDVVATGRYRTQTKNHVQKLIYGVRIRRPSHIHGMTMQGHRAMPMHATKLGQVGIGSNIAQNHSYSLYEVIPGHYWPQLTWKMQYEIRSSYYLLTFGLIYPYLAPKYQFCPYLDLLTYIYRYLPIVIDLFQFLISLHIFIYIILIILQIHYNCRGWNWRTSIAWAVFLLAQTYQKHTCSFIRIFNL